MTNAYPFVAVNVIAEDCVLVYKQAGDVGEENSAAERVHVEPEEPHVLQDQSAPYCLHGRPHRRPWIRIREHGVCYMPNCPRNCAGDDDKQ